MRANRFVIIFVTTPKRYSKIVAKQLLGKKLVACVNIVKKVSSMYWWENKICTDEEELLVLKTKKILLKKIIEEIKKVHPYKVPEIISVEINKGNKEYLSWIDEVVV